MLVQTAVAREQFSKHAVFYLRSVSRLGNKDKLPLAVSPSRVWVERELAGSQLRGAAGCCVRGHFGDPDEGERPPLEDVTKQRSEDRD
jgi:hypothetical protein